jgi:PTH1 family peptidyl-tRNA hydrolase
MLHLVVFFGNPGAKYAHNRHNAGWMLAEALPFFSVFDWKRKFRSLYTCLDDICKLFPNELPPSIQDDIPVDMPNRTGKLHFIKPQTFMNLSGESAYAVASFYKISTNEIIVVHDDIELPFGTLSLKFSGGLGGHNGLRSMKNYFGSADFWRLRLGIGRPDGRIPGRGGNPESSRRAGIADWVLNDFSAAEAEALTPVFNTGAGVLVHALACGPECLLPRWTKKDCLAQV